MDVRNKVVGVVSGALLGTWGMQLVACSGGVPPLGPTGASAGDAAASGADTSTPTGNGAGQASSGGDGAAPPNGSSANRDAAAALDATSPGNAGPGDADTQNAPADAEAAPVPDFAWYLLNETSGTTAHDSSPNHYDITNLTNVTWFDGAVFDSSLAVCGWTSVPAGWRQPPATISAWLTPLPRSDSTVNSYSLTPFPSNAVSGDIPAEGGYGFGINVWIDGNAGSGLAVEKGITETVGFTTVGSFVSGQRYLVTVVETATAASIYVDGQLLAATAASVPTADVSPLLYLGCHNQETGYASKRFYNGDMRDVRVYKRALSAGEVQELFGAGPAASVQ